MGVEMRASDLHYVVITREHDGVSIGAHGRITLHSTRDLDDVRNFQLALRTVLEDAGPERIAIKLKPEKGKPGMIAGPAALKMEVLVLANSQCEVAFVSGARMSKIKPVENPLKQYLQEALCAALAVDP